MARKPLSITISEEALSRIDSFCKGRGLNRSALLELAAVSYIDAEEMKPTVQKVMGSFADIASQVVSGELTPHEAEIKLSALKEVSGL